MTLSDLITAARTHLLGPRWAPWARGVWCRAQRRQLSVPGHPVVWVRGETLPWAEWGAQRGYFEVQQMDGLSYLRAIGAPVA